MRQILLFLALFITGQTWGISVAHHQFDAGNVGHVVNEYVYDVTVNLQVCCGIHSQGQNANDGYLLALTGDFLAPKKGLTTPNKYFGSKTYKEAEKALTDKFGPPRGGGKFNKSFFNEKTGRTYNLHKDPSHRGGKGHICLPVNGTQCPFWNIAWMVV